jgi:hypothetical protein
MPFRFLRASAVKFPNQKCFYVIVSDPAYPDRPPNCGGIISHDAPNFHQEIPVFLIHAASLTFPLPAAISNP